MHTNSRRYLNGLIHSWSVCWNICYQITHNLRPPCLCAMARDGAESSVPTSLSSSSSHDPSTALLSVLCFHANRPSRVKYLSCSAAEVRCLWLLLAACKHEPDLVYFFMTEDYCSMQWDEAKLNPSEFVKLKTATTPTTKTLHCRTYCLTTLCLSFFSLPTEHCFGNTDIWNLISCIIHEQIMI